MKTYCYLASILLITLFASPTAKAQEFYVSCADTDSVKKVSAAGVVTTFATGFADPRGLAVDISGNLYVACQANGDIMKITPEGVSSLFAHVGSPLGLAFDSAGDLFVSDYSSAELLKITPDGNVSVVATNIDSIEGLAYDSVNDIFYATSLNDSVLYKITRDGGVTNLLDFPAESQALACKDGILYGTKDFGIYTMTSSGVISPFNLDAAQDGFTFGIDGHLYSLQWNGTIQRFALDGSSHTTFATVGDWPMYIVSTTVNLPATLSANPVGATNATLNGRVMGSGAPISVYFEYGETTAYDSFSTTNIIADSSNPQNVGIEITNLLPQTTYYFRIVSVEGTNSYGADLSFCTTAFPPTVTTLAATDIIDDSASLNASIDTKDSETFYYFRYGTTTNYSHFSDTNVLSGSELPDTVNATISGLTANTTYHFCAVAVNSGGSVQGEDLTFTTPVGFALVTTLPATDVVSTTATLNGVVNENGSPTDTYFEYGTNTSYGGAVAAIRTPRGAALSFNGVDQYVEVPASINASFTIEFWFKSTDTGGNENNWYSGKGLVDETANGSDFGVTLGGGKVMFGVGSPDITIKSDFLADGNWHHVAATRNHLLGTMELFIDGVSTASTTGANTSVLTPANRIVIGGIQYLNSAQFFNGSIDDVRLWSVVRTPTEIQDNMNEPLAGSETGLAAYYQFDEGTGDVATDFSNNGNTGTLYSSPIWGLGTIEGNTLFDSAAITGLLPNTEYHFRIVGINAAGTSIGADETFTTRPELFPALATTLPATNVVASVAFLNAEVDPKESETGVYFEYGLDTDYGDSTEVIVLPASGGPELISLLQSGLMPGTEYHFRVVATNEAGITLGNDLTFITPAASPIETQADSFYLTIGDLGRVRKVAADGTYTTFASASLGYPTAVTLDTNGNVYVMNYELNRIRRITPTGTANNYVTFPLSVDPVEMVGDKHGNLFVSDFAGGTIRKVSPATATTGTASTFATGLGYITELAIDHETGNLYATDAYTGVVWKVSPTGVATEFFSDVPFDSITFKNGVLYGIDSLEACLYRVDADGTATLLNQDDLFYSAFSLTEGSSGNFYAVNDLDNRMIRLSEDGSTVEYFGTDNQTDPIFMVANFLPLTRNATNINDTTATLHASVNPNHLVTRAYFQFGTTTNYGSFSTTNFLSATNDFISVSNAVSGLLPGTVYHFRSVALNGGMTNLGPDMTFTTLTPVTPLITTVSATDIASNQAALQALVSPNGFSTAVYFRYGTSTNYGSYSDTNFFVGTDANQPVAINVAGLLPGTVYNFQAVAKSVGGTNQGSNLTFTTLAGTPSAVTLSAGPVTAIAATLNGTVNPNGSDTDVYFEFGPNTSYGSFSTTNTVLGTNNSVAVMNTVAGLLPGNTYHFRVVARNGSGTTLGQDLSFTTPALVPSITTATATAITVTSATLHATVNPNGAATAVYFQFGTNASYGSLSGTNYFSATNQILPAASSISGLLPGTVYHFRAVAVNGQGTSTGNDLTFETLPLPAPTILSIEQQPDLTTLLQFSGEPDLDYTLKISEDLQDWQTLTNLESGTNGLFEFNDLDSTNHTIRFYRLMYP